MEEVAKLCVCGNKIAGMLLYIDVNAPSLTSLHTHTDTIQPNTHEETKKLVAAYLNGSGVLAVHCSGPSQFPPLSYLLAVSIYTGLQPISSNRRTQLGGGKQVTRGG